MPEISDSLGSYLRAEREQQGVDLHDMAAATKIQLKFLQALEDDTYEQLPTGPFAIGFLRTYAHYLGLNAEDIVAAYHARHQTPPQQEEPQPSSVPSRFFDQRRIRVGLGVGLLGLGCMALLLVRGSGTPPQVILDTSEVTATHSNEPVTSGPVLTPEPPPAALLASPLDAPVVLHEQPAVPVPPVTPPPDAVEAATTAENESQMVADASDTSEPPAAAELAQETPLILQITALEDTWLEVESDHDTHHRMLLKSGRSARWEATEHFGLTIGNIQGTYVLLNGQEIALPAGRGNVLRDFSVTEALLP